MANKYTPQMLLGTVQQGDKLHPIESARSITRGNTYVVVDAYDKVTYIIDDRGYTVKLDELSCSWYLGPCEDNLETQTFESLSKKGLTKEDYKGMFDFLEEWKVRIFENPILSSPEQVSYSAPGIPMISTDSGAIVNYLWEKDKLRSNIKANKIKSLKAHIQDVAELLIRDKQKLKQLESE